MKPISTAAVVALLLQFGHPSVASATPRNAHANRPAPENWIPAVAGQERFIIVSPELRGPAPKVEEGDAAPKFVLKNIHGEEVALSTGVATLLAFGTTWCPPCKNAVGTLKEIDGEFSGESFHVLGIYIQESQEVVAKHASEQGISYEALLDADAAVFKSYGLSGFPAFFVVDGKGIVRYRLLGFGNDAGETLRQKVREVLSGTPGSVS